MLRHQFQQQGCPRPTAHEKKGGRFPRYTKTTVGLLLGCDYVVMAGCHSYPHWIDYFTILPLIASIILLYPMCHKMIITAARRFVMILLFYPFTSNSDLISAKFLEHNDQEIRNFFVGYT